MHELPVTQALLEVVLRTAAEQGARRVLAIELVIGELTTIVDDSVQFYFDLLSQGTPAEGAVLHFHRQPAQATCGDCGYSWEVTPPLEPLCPTCGGLRLRVEGGRAFRVETIEVDDEDPGGAENPERQ